MSIKDDLFALPGETAPITIKGKVYHVREISGEEFDNLLAKAKDKNGTLGQKGLMARFVVAGISDEAGNRAFSDDDHEKVNRLPFKLLMALAKAVQKHNGLTQDDADEILGKSAATPS